MIASSTLVAERYPAHQGKAQSFLIVVAQLPISVAHFVYSRLYRAKAVGVEQSLPFVVASVAAWLGYVCLMKAFVAPVQSLPELVEDAEADLVCNAGDISPIGNRLS